VKSRSYGDTGFLAEPAEIHNRRCMNGLNTGNRNRSHTCSDSDGFFSVTHLEDAVEPNTLRFPQYNHEDFSIGTVNHAHDDRKHPQDTHIVYGHVPNWTECRQGQRSHQGNVETCNSGAGSATSLPKPKKSTKTQYTPYVFKNYGQ
jgi:hypothetical protein